MPYQPSRLAGATLAPRREHSGILAQARDHAWRDLWTRVASEAIAMRWYMSQVFRSSAPWKPAEMPVNVAFQFTVNQR